MGRAPPDMDGCGCGVNVVSRLEAMSFVKKTAVFRSCAASEWWSSIRRLMQSNGLAIKLTLVRLFRGLAPLGCDQVLHLHLFHLPYISYIRGRVR